MSVEATYLLSTRHPALRRQDLKLGHHVERENLFLRHGDSPIKCVNHQ